MGVLMRRSSLVVMKWIDDGHPKFSDMAMLVCNGVCGVDAKWKVTVISGHADSSSTRIIDFMLTKCHLLSS